MGRLWEDVTRSPYTDIFGPDTSATRLWRCVEVLRAVEAELASQRRVLEGRDRLVAVHGNRLIASLVVARLPVQSLADPTAAIEPVLAAVPEHTRQVLNAVREVVAGAYPANYPASIFKNVTKCRDIEATVATRLAT